MGGGWLRWSRGGRGKAGTDEAAEDAAAVAAYDRAVAEGVLGEPTISLEGLMAELGDEVTDYPGVRFMIHARIAHTPPTPAALSRAALSAAAIKRRDGYSSCSVGRPTPQVPSGSNRTVAAGAVAAPFPCSTTTSTAARTPGACRPVVIPAIMG